MDGGGVGNGAAAAGGGSDGSEAGGGVGVVIEGGPSGRVIIDGPFIGRLVVVQGGFAGHLAVESGPTGDVVVEGGSTTRHTVDGGSTGRQVVDQGPTGTVLVVGGVSPPGRDGGDRALEGIYDVKIAYCSACQSFVPPVSIADGQAYICYMCNEFVQTLSPIRNPNPPPGEARLTIDFTLPRSFLTLFSGVIVEGGEKGNLTKSFIEEQVEGKLKAIVDRIETVATLGYRLQFQMDGRAICYSSDYPCVLNFALSTSDYIISQLRDNTDLDFQRTNFDRVEQRLAELFLEASLSSENPPAPLPRSFFTLDVQTGATPPPSGQPAGISGPSTVAPTKTISIYFPTSAGPGDRYGLWEDDFSEDGDMQFSHPPC